LSDVGTGKLKPFKKDDTGWGVETISSSKSKNGPSRGGFFDNLMTTQATKNVTKLDPRAGTIRRSGRRLYVQRRR